MSGQQGKWRRLRETIETERVIWSQDATVHHRARQTVLHHRAEGRAAMCADILLLMDSIEDAERAS